MSAGRNLRPETTSYKETGIPCGNPTRYKSRGVIRMNTRDVTPYVDQRFDQPGEGTESEADQHLKRMVQNQLDTTITLESQKTKRRTFTSSTTLKSFDPASSGALSLKAYKTLEDQKRYIEQLEQYGLTEEEIQFKFEQEGLVSKAAKQSRYGENPEAKVERLQRIQQKIEDKESALARPDLFTNVQTLSRHAMEVETSLNKGTERAESFKHLVQLTSSGFGMEDPLFKAVFDVERASTPDGKSPESQSEVELHEAKTGPDNSRGSSLKSSTQEKRAKFSESSGCDGRLRLQSRVDPIPEEDIIDNRLTLDAIREIPRFRDYSPGKPSKILYLKNLSCKVTEEDLVRLFVGFQREEGPKLVFRLMSGRMKGQAFVTLEDSETATRALDLVNGYQLKGKPVIIQYGKHTNSS